MPQPFAPTDFEPLDTSDFEPLPAVQPAKQLARMNGPIPAGTPIMGGPIPIVPLMGPVLPHVLSSAVGYGADKLGQAMGLPDWANAALGIGAGGLTVGAGRLAKAAGGAMDNVPPGAGKFANTILKKVVPGYKWFDAAREAMKPEAPPAFEPFKPSPGVARKMPYGGPVDTAGGPSYGPPTAPAKFTPIEPPVPPKPVEPWKPNKVNPAIKKKMNYGGADDQYGTPAYRNPVKRMGGGGGAVGDVNTVGAPPSTKPPAPPAQTAPPPPAAPAPMQGPGVPLSPAVKAEAEAAFKSGAPTAKPGYGSAHDVNAYDANDAVAVKDRFKNAARTAWGNTLGGKLRAEKIDLPAAESFTPEQWDAHAREIGIKPSSPDKIQKALENLRTFKKVEDIKNR